jgi:uncharacterized protein (TIGR03437 family)
LLSAHAVTATTAANVVQRADVLVVECGDGVQYHRAKETFMRALAGLFLAALCWGTATPKAVIERLPILFEPGTGAVRYRAHTGAFRLEIMDDGPDWTGASSRIRIRFAGANRAARPRGVAPLAAKTNYFHGSSWRTGVLNYSRVRYEGIYPGIDALFYGSDGVLEYDFVAAPGADPGRIRFQAAGANIVRLDHGDVVLSTADGEMRWRKPVVYQRVGEVIESVDARFHLEGSAVSFDLGPYDHGRELIIDPVLSYAGLVGGSGSDNIARCAVDSAGNLYVTGKTSSNDLPVTRTAPQPAYGGNTTNFLTGDAFVAKFGPSGALIYMTYLGGDADDYGTGIAVDGSGNAYVTGMTNSRNFPVTEGVLQGRFGGTSTIALNPFGDAFVTKLNASGSALLYSTYLGGSRDDEGTAITIDSSGNAYVVGDTQSSNFPGVAGGFQSRYGGEGGQPGIPDAGSLPRLVTGDAFLAKINPSGSQVVFATYIGGPADDEALGVALDPAGNIIVCGHTLSSFNFPVTPGIFQRAYRGADSGNTQYNLGDGFVTKVSPSGALIFSTYIGGSGDESVNGVAVDAAGNIYGVGSTTSIDFPATSDALIKSYQGPTSLLNFLRVKIGDGFVFKMKPDGTGLLNSTYLGGEADDAAMQIALDASGKVFVAGFTGSDSFPITADATQRSSGGKGGGLFNFTSLGDAFLVQLGPSLDLQFSTYLGGSNDDVAAGLAVDGNGNVYLAGGTGSANFPMAGDVTGRFHGANPVVFPQGDGFIAKFAFGAGGNTTFNITAVQNAASYTDAVAPGMFFIVKGNGLGPKDLALGTFNQQTRRQDTIAAGTRVLFDGVPAPMVYAWGPQSAGVVPYAVGGKTSVQVVVEYNGQRTGAFTARVQDAVPGLFSADLSGAKQAAAYNQDGQRNSAAVPAAPGSIVLLFGTGDGLQNGPVSDGQVIAGSALTKSTLPVRVTIGGLPANIAYAGAVPDQVAGVFQVNAQIPDATAPGDTPVVVSFGSAASQANLTIAVR